MNSLLFRALSRQTNTTKLIPEIDGFRFFAIASVVAYHLNTHLSRTIRSVVDREYFTDTWIFQFASTGGIGVNVFFAISGFILALPFARQHLFGERVVSLRAYFWRRITRLEPPYVLSLVLLLAVHVWILGSSLSEVFPNFVASLFYLHNIIFDEWSVINPVAWSLEVEVQFYILAPFLAIVFSISNPLVRRLVIVVVIAVNIMHYNLNYEWIETYHLRKSILMHLHQFFVGFFFADLFLTTWKSWLKRQALVFDVLGFVALLSLFFVYKNFSMINDFLFVIFLFIGFVCLFKGRLLNTFFSNPWIVVIGGMCYSIYLLHYALLALLVEGSKVLFYPELGYTLNYLIQLILLVPVVLIVSGVYFVLFERPFMDRNWPSKLRAKVTRLFTPSAS